MFFRIARVVSPAFVGVALLLSAFAGSRADGTQPTASADGVVKVGSAYEVDETVARLKQDIAGKGIMFFAEIDQARLAAWRRR